MRKSFKGEILLSTAVLLVALAAMLPSFNDHQKNTVEITATHVASPRAKALHGKLFVADMHDDALLWKRNLLERHAHGHSDLPRLQSGGVGLQIFSAVTKTPRNLNYDNNKSDSDNITLLAMTSLWPVRTWDSLLERALYMSEKLHTAQAGSQGKMRIIRSREDLTQLVQTDAKNGVMGALLATEGLQPLEGKLENIDKLFDAGYRIAGLTHFQDNEVGGSAQGAVKGGLTPFGRQVVAQLEQRHMLVDLAHASPALIDDVLAMATQPVIVSHTGVQGTCDKSRNLTDAHIRGIAATGGLIGIGYFDEAVCELSAQAIVKAIRYTVDLVGIKHVALGSDFDGAVRVAFDSEGLSRLTQGLMESGFVDDEIAAIMGGNVRDLLLVQLPSTRSTPAI